MKTPCSRVGERGDGCGWQAGIAIDEDDMAADPERWRDAGEINGFVGGGGASHERGAGEGAGLVQFDHGAVDAVGEAEVVSVYDETGHWVV